MPRIKIPCSPQKSNIFGAISRPLVTIKVYSNTKNVWIPVYDTLADTGADITLLPRYLGEMIVDDITTGKYAEIKGVAPNAVLAGFIHDAKIEVFRKEINTKVIIGDSDDVRPVLGRLNGLDLFDITFSKGEYILID